MKALLTWFTISVLVGSLMAQTSTTTTTRKRKAAAPPPPPAVTVDDLNALKAALAQQQQQIQDLQGKMAERDAALQQTQQQLQQAQTQLQDAQSKASSAASNATQTSDSISKLQNDVADIRLNTTNLAATAQDDQKKVSALSSAFGKIRFSGDVRVRGETFIQDATQDRNRARIRVRLGLDGQLNQDFLGGLALATGSQGDPTTTNETLTNAFDRKTIALDKGYITYNPTAHSWFSATGGKFAYQWQRTPVTGDSDLNPEGFNQKLSFDIHHGVFKNVTVQAIELLYGESSSGQDSYVLGAQGQTKWEIGPWTATASLLNLHFNRPDALLNASGFATQATNTGTFTGTTGATTFGPFPITGEGPGCATNNSFFPKFPNCVFAPNGMTNAISFDAAGKPHFYSGFDELDFILNNTFKTPSARFPITLLLEYEQNLDAAAHPLSATAVSGNSALSFPVLTNLGSQNKSYGGDFSIGQTKNKNDLQFGYAWLRQEQDSVLASITESDQRAPTNVLQNKFYANWKLRSNTVAQFTWWYGRVLNSNLENNAAKTPGVTEPWLTRMQYDLVYTF
jgi:Putative porin